MGEVPQGLENYSYLSAHQPGAEHAPLYFISGKLFTLEVRKRVYERLEVPTLVLFDKDAYVTFEKLPELLVANARVRAVKLEPSRGLPQWEIPKRTADVLSAFWQDPEAAYPPAAIRVVVDDSVVDNANHAADDGTAKRQENAVPRAKGFDDSLELLNEGYTFISERCRDLNTNIFETRLRFEKTICMRGRDAAELFYNQDHFMRAGAAPKRLTQTLFGKGGVQGLDGEAHTHRKAMFMALMSQIELQRMVDLSAEGWRSYAQRWTGAGAGRSIRRDDGTPFPGSVQMGGGAS